MAILTTFNNKTDIKNLICFDSCPNILTISSDSSKGTYEMKKYNVQNMRSVDPYKEKKIIVNGYAINGVNTFEESSIGRNFYYLGDQNSAYCAISIVNALKNVPELVMNYNIIYESEGVFSITAKNEGKRYKLNVTFENLREYSEIESNSGSTTDELYSEYSTKIYLDIFYNDKSTQRVINSSSPEADFTYLTTLQKEYYKDSVSFNITPAISSISSNLNTAVFKIVAYGFVDGIYKNLGVISDNYIINGYLVNQGKTYIDANGITNQTIPALNVSKGEERTQYNNSLLYIYKPNFVISLFRNNGISTENVTINYLESDEQVISSSSTTLYFTEISNIDTFVISLDEDIMRDSYYIDLTFSFGTIRLNVINPPFANAECNRVYWYNSYGGMSFFDFVGDKSEERKTEVETYNKSLLDFYNNQTQEQEIVYSRENDITVSLTTHLIDKDGLYQLYDLQNSYKAWISIDNVNYYIIIESVTVEEPSDNIYTATIKYKYSLLDSFA